MTATQMVTFDRRKAERLRRSYQRALDDGESTFVFQGHELLVAYARFMLMYLDERLDQ